jgi:hypothetical protein
MERKYSACGWECTGRRAIREGGSARRQRRGTAQGRWRVDRRARTASAGSPPFASMPWLLRFCSPRRAAESVGTCWWWTGGDRTEGDSGTREIVLWAALCPDQFSFFSSLSTDGLLRNAIFQMGCEKFHP